MSSSSSSTNLDVTLSLSLPSRNDCLNPKERGIKLIKLLINCANHASTGNLHHADTCLRQITELASVSGDATQRLAARFAFALAGRVVKRWPGLYKALSNDGPAMVGFDMDRARSIFIRAFPYLGFAYAVINRTLVQAMQGERVIHVIDLGSGDPKLWVPFIRAVSDGPDGPPRMKLTYISKNKEAQKKLKYRVVKEAKSLNMEFEFNFVNVSLRELTLDMLKVKTGEALALVSCLTLHVLLAEDDRVNAFGIRKSNQVNGCSRMKEFLEMVKSIGPKVVLLVEQESNHNSIRLVDRFVEGLHFYSALFDSIDTIFGGLSCSDRMTLEEMFGKEIENIVVGEGMEREERHERYVKWVIRLSRAGLRPVRLWSETMDEARKVVDSYGTSGFKIASEKAGLMICPFMQYQHGDSFSALIIHKFDVRILKNKYFFLSISQNVSHIMQ